MNIFYEVIRIARYFIAVIQDSLSIVLVLAVMFTLLRKNKYQKQYIASGIVLGLIAASIAAYIRNIPNFINRTKFSYYSLIPLFILLFIYFIIIRNWMEKKFPKLQAKLLPLVTLFYTMSACFYYLPTIFLYPKKFVNYGESAFTTEVLLKVIGYIGGIGFVLLIGVAVYKAASKISEEGIRFFISLVLIIFGLTQSAIILQHLYSFNYIPRKKLIFQYFVFIINHANYFIYILMLVLLGLSFVLYQKNKRITETYSSPAELRKIKARMRNARRWAATVFVFFFLATMTLSLLKHISEKETPLSPPEPYETEGDTVKISMQLLEDDHLHRFEYISENNRRVRFIALRKSPGSYAVCYDACDVCGVSGYFERKEKIVCKLCDVVMNRGTIGIKGGCNPIPLPFEIVQSYLEVKMEDLEEQSELFR